MPRASLTPSQLAVEPGASASFTLEVAADGDGGADLCFEVLGPAAGWTLVVPPRVSVPAGGSARARVVVQVPRSPRAAPGPAALTVSAGGQVAATATVDVLPFAEVRASLSPRVTRSRTGGRHTLLVETLGNRRVTATVEPGVDGSVRVELDRVSLDLAPGDGVSVPVRVRARRPRLLGRSRALPFRVAVREGRAQPAVTAEGMHVQDRLRWPLGAAAVVGAAVVVGALASGRGDDPTVVAGGAPPHSAVAGVPGQAAACPPQPADPAAPLNVQNFLFCPPTLTVAPGTELRWVNRDSAPHTASADSGEFDTGNFGQGEVRSVRFQRPGTFPYFCRLHPFMRGTVVVA